MSMREGIERLQVGAVNSLSIDGGIKANDLHKITCLWTGGRTDGEERKEEKQEKRRKED